MIVEPNIQSTRQIIQSWRRAGCTICLVPTMGYFHDGHTALMRKGTSIADKVIVSLFVNPTQFGPHEDLANYPRDPAGDAAKAQQAGVDLIFCPNVTEIYPDGHQTRVSVAQLSEGLCGKDRPGHFTGVTTVVSKLFNIIQPDSAIFGEKDFQQLLVIKQMTRDLNFPVNVIGHPIVRESDGLAMSSRNAYLNVQERKIALVLYKTLQMIKTTISKAEKPVESAPLLKAARKLIDTQENCRVDYLSVIDEVSLQEKKKIEGTCRIAGAIMINDRIRLIDNISVTN